MRLADLKMAPFESLVNGWEVAPPLHFSGKTVFVFCSTAKHDKGSGLWIIYLYDGHVENFTGNTRRSFSNKWEWLDPLTAQCILYELTGEGSCCPQAHSS
jgi:hypothetical protein